MACQNRSTVIKPRRLATPLYILLKKLKISLNNCAQLRYQINESNNCPRPLRIRFISKYLISTFFCRFDGRANLDVIPDYNSSGKKDEVESCEESRQLRQVHYEGYRILIQNQFLEVHESKFLKEIELEEKFGETSYQMKKSKDDKKNSSNSAAIGFTYDDTEVVGGAGGDSGGEESGSEPDLDFDPKLELDDLSEVQQFEINKESFCNQARSLIGFY